MSTQTSLYAILEIDPKCDALAIRSAYRRLALRYHPDKNPDPQAINTFRAVQSAYDILKDPLQRAKYDALGQGANMKESTPAQQIFAYYCELMQTICEEYNLSEEESSKLRALFRIEDYESELASGDFTALTCKISTKLMAHILLGQNSSTHTGWASTLGAALGSIFGTWT